MTTTTHEVPMTKSKREALHLRYGTMEDLTLSMLLATDDLPPNARSVITAITIRRRVQKARDDEALQARPSS